MIDAELLAVVALRAELPEAALARLGGRLGQATRLAMEELSAATQSERTRRSARVLAALSSPVPASVRRAHRQWVEAALAAEPEAASLLSSPSQAPAAVWLARRAFGTFPHAAANPSELAGVEDWLRHRGALALASVVRERRALVSASLAQLAEGDEQSAALLSHTLRRLERGEQEPPARRAAVAACQGVELRRPEALTLIGVTLSSRELQEEAARWRALLIYLPRAVGEAIANIVG